MNKMHDARKPEKKNELAVIWCARELIVMNPGQIDLLVFEIWFRFDHFPHCIVQSNDQPIELPPANTMSRQKWIDSIRLFVESTDKSREEQQKRTNIGLFIIISVSRKPLIDY